MAESSATTSPQGTLGGGTHDDSVKRRDFLYLATAAFATAGVALAAWPFIDSMNPAADVRAAGAPMEVDLSKIEAGQQILVKWRGTPMFLLRRTDQMLKILQSKAQLAVLRDPDSLQLQQPKYAVNWHRSIKPEFAILVAICTHLGCIPEFRPEAGSLTPDWPGGYFCPCHGSKYDFAGRVYKGVPAPLNLPVPPYHFTDDTTIRIGENPKGSKFNLNDVETL